MVWLEISWEGSHHVAALMEPWQKSSSCMPLIEIRGIAKRLADQLTDTNDCEALTPTNNKALGYDSQSCLWITMDYWMNFMEKENGYCFILSLTTAARPFLCPTIPSFLCFLSEKGPTKPKHLMLLGCVYWSVSVWFKVWVALFRESAFQMAMFHSLASSVLLLCTLWKGPQFSHPIPNSLSVAHFSCSLSFCSESMLLSNSHLSGLESCFPNLSFEILTLHVTIIGDRAIAEIIMG